MFLLFLRRFFFSLLFVASYILYTFELVSIEQIITIIILLLTRIISCTNIRWKSRNTPGRSNREPQERGFIVNFKALGHLITEITLSFDETFLTRVIEIQRFCTLRRMTGFDLLFKITNWTIIWEKSTRIKVHESQKSPAIVGDAEAPRPPFGHPSAASC